MKERFEKILARKGYKFFAGMVAAGVSTSTAYKIKNEDRNILLSTLDDAWKKVKSLDKRS